MADSEKRATFQSTVIRSGTHEPVTIWSIASRRAHWISVFSLTILSLIVGFFTLQDNVHASIKDVVRTEFRSEERELARVKEIDARIDVKLSAAIAAQNAEFNARFHAIEIEAVQHLADISTSLGKLETQLEEVEKQLERIQAQ